MTWTDAARRAALEARKRNAKRQPTTGGAFGRGAPPETDRGGSNKLRNSWGTQGAGAGAKKAAANTRRRAAANKQPGGFWGGPGSLTPNQRRARERRG